MRPWPVAPGRSPPRRRSPSSRTRSSGERAYHFLMEGFGRALILGMTGEDVFARLRWLRDDAAPALDAAIQALGGIDCDEIMCEALRRGDELHNRNAAANSMLAERLAAGMARAGVSAELQERILEFLRGNPQFFVAVSLATTRLMLDRATGRRVEPGYRGRLQRHRMRDQGLRAWRPVVRGAGGDRRGTRARGCRSRRRRARLRRLDAGRVRRAGGVGAAGGARVVAAAGSRRASGPARSTRTPRRSRWPNTRATGCRSSATAERRSGLTSTRCSRPASGP